MNPYLLIKKEPPIETYFIAKGVLRTEWPETAPASSQEPEFKLEIVEEWAIGEHSSQPDCAGLRMDVFVEGKPYSHITGRKCLILDDTGVLKYSPSISLVDESFRRAFIKIPFSLDFEDTVESAAHELTEGWIPPVPKTDSPFFETVVAEAILNSASLLVIEHPEYPDINAEVLWGAWNYDPDNQKPALWFVVYPDITFAKAQASGNPRDAYIEKIKNYTLHTTPREAVSYVSRVLDYMLELTLKQKEEHTTELDYEHFMEYGEERKIPKQKFTPITPEEHEEWVEDIVYTLQQLSSDSIKKSYS